MYKIKLSKEARKQFLSLDGSQKIIIAKHFAKMQNHLPRKRLVGNSEFLIEEIGQGRIICLEENGSILKVIHIFSTHKEYEKWFNGA